MPFYDLMRPTNTSGTPLTEVTHLAGKSVATAETFTLSGLYACARFGTAGGGTVRIKTNTAGGTVFSGGTATVPTPKNPRSPAAQTTWVNDVTTITPGTTLLERIFAGFAQTGGQGGYVPIVLGAGIVLLSGATPNPVDIELTSLAAGATVPIDTGIEGVEGNS
jgi:hypothetical protein